MVGVNIAIVSICSPLHLYGFSLMMRFALAAVILWRYIGCHRLGRSRLPLFSQVTRRMGFILAQRCPQGFIQFLMLPVYLYIC